MMHSDDATDTPQRLAEASPAMRWIVRIGVTVFLIPFFVVGAGMVFGGGFFGGIGWLGSLFGLAFLAVPCIMLAAVWMSPATSKRAPGIVNEPASLEPSRPATAPPRLVACAYCGRPRPEGSATCESCGAH